MRGIQILGILVGLYLIWRSFTHTRKNKGDINIFLIWVVVGASIVAGSAFPEIAGIIAGMLGMKIRAYTVFSVAFVVVFVLLINIYRQIRQLNDEMSRMNEELSLKNIKR